MEVALSILWIDPFAGKRRAKLRFEEATGKDCLESTEPLACPLSARFPERDGDEDRGVEERAFQSRESRNRLSAPGFLAITGKRRLRSPGASAGRMTPSAVSRAIL